ncbi:MAG: LarC family nickel insertion protein [Clostridiaceae bacterium]|nr:LarC family nickel insertion protein [Clostridiaceae bacterium]
MSNGNTLYLECRSGISGDMTVAALLDLGATEENLRASLATLPVKGYELVIKKIMKNGLKVSDFDVILEQEIPTHSHDHMHDTEHSHDHMHPHVHRSWAGIEKMLLEADLKPRVKDLSLQMFRTVAEAEAKVHGKSIDEVHFHEVGAVDSIVDIVGTAICLDELQVDKIVVSELTEGCGHIQCQHGSLPVPVPAVLEIAAAHGLTFHQIEQEGEMVTPTGAAIAALSEGHIPGIYCVKKIGMGAGKREYKNTNILRAMLIEEK